MGLENSLNGTLGNYSSLNGNVEKDLCNVDKYFYILENSVNILTYSYYYT